MSSDHWLSEYIYTDFLLPEKTAATKVTKKNQPTNQPGLRSTTFSAFRQVKGSVLRKAGEPLNTLGYQALLGGF